MNRRRSATGRTRLRDVGEDRLLDMLLAGSPLSDRAVVLGPGDDCAVVRLKRSTDLLVLKTDSVVERVHFESSANPVDVGWKAMMRPLSDFAAMAAMPRFALITLIVPGARSTMWVRQMYRGLRRAAAVFNVEVIGGETSDTPGPAAISVNVIGSVQKGRFVARSGGRPNDDLFVTGTLGGSIRGKHLRFVPRIEEAQWLAKNFRIHAMMDLSDGLGADLPRLARASKVGFAVDSELLPLTRGCSGAQAMNDGEDYELLFAVSPSERERLERLWPKKFPKVRLTRIGSLNRQSTIKDRKFRGGYIHFQRRR
jgi:thiamine-monophosphate kinase